MCTSGKQLLSPINDALDISHIESGSLVLRDEEFDFNDFLKQINTIIGGRCANKGLSKRLPREDIGRDDDMFPASASHCWQKYYQREISDKLFTE